METVSIRPASRDDLEALARVHVRSWQAAYRGAFPDEFLDALEPADRIPSWERHLSSEGLETLVAADGDAVVGFVLIGPERSGEEVGEVYAIYLEPEVWGRGIGRALLAAAEDRMVERGFSEAVLWVLDRNDRARRFYEAAGWGVDGGVKSEPIFGRDATELRYRRRLD